MYSHNQTCATIQAWCFLTWSIFTTRTRCSRNTCTLCSTSSCHTALSPMFTCLDGLNIDTESDTDCIAIRWNARITMMHCYMFKPTPVHHREKVHHRSLNSRNSRCMLKLYHSTPVHSQNFVSTHASLKPTQNLPRNFPCRNSIQYKSNRLSSYMLLIHSHYYNHISSRILELIFEPPCRHHAQLLGEI